MKIKLPVSRKRYEQELDGIASTAAVVLKRTETAKKLTEEQVDRLTQHIKKSNSDYAELSSKYDSLCELHSNRIRIGTIDVDPLTITAKLRAVEPTIRVEFDGKKLFLYADKVLTEPEFNQLEGMLRVHIDRT